MYLTPAPSFEASTKTNISWYFGVTILWCAGFSATNFVMILASLSALVSSEPWVSRWFSTSFPRDLFIGENKPFSQGTPNASCLIFPFNRYRSLWDIYPFRSDCVISCMMTFIFFGGSSIIFFIPSMIHPSVSFLVFHIPSCANLILEILSRNTEFIPCRITLEKCCICSKESFCVIPMKLHAYNSITFSSLLVLTGFDKYGN